MRRSSRPLPRRVSRRAKASAFRSQRRLRIESLETRTLLDGESPAQPVSGEFRVNTTTEDDQAFQAASPHGVAMDADGDAVVVWASQNQDGDGLGVFGRRIAPDGTPSEDEFQVNTFVDGDQSNASVAMDPDGDFVVVWNSAGQDGDRSGIFAQRYDARGLPRGGEFRVNQTVANEQLLPTVATDAFGNFVIVWRNVVGEDTQATDEIVGRMFDSDGVPRGNEFVISEPTTLDLRQPHVARNAQGEFVVVWEREGTPLPGSSFGQDVYGRTFAADGTPLSGEFRVPEITAGQQIRPTVAMKASGDFIVTWYNQSTQRPDIPVDVFVRRFSRSGEPLGPDGLVNATVSAAEQRFPSIAIDAVGNYTIAWASRVSTNSSYDVFQQAFSAAGEKIGGEAQVNQQTPLDQSLPSIGMSANGDFLVAWTSAGQDGDGNGIYARRYARGEDLAPPTVTNVYLVGDDHALADGEIVLQQPSRLVATFSEAIDVDPGTNARSKWKLYRNGVDVSQQVAVATHVFNGAANRYEAVLDFQSPLSAGEYVLHALPTLRDMQGHALDGDYDGEAGGNFERRFSVTAPEVGDEFRLNQTTQGDQTFVGGAAQTIARDALGNFVAVWKGSTDSSAIWMRRFNAQGEPATLVDERVSDAGVNGDVSQPTVAMAADGRFVVAWLRNWQVSDDVKYYYIEARRYAADGTPLGSRINVYEREDVRQERPTIAINELGEFAVVWQGAGQPNGSGFEILMQRFDSDGSMIGARTRVNQAPTGDQTAPSVAMDAHGDVVVVWTDAMPAGLTQRRILARRFSSALDRFNLPLRVSGEDEDLATGDHVNPSVAVAASGHFVVAWQSNENSPDPADIYARRFDENDEPLEEVPFRANLIAGGSQQYPSVAIDADGDFVVAWQSSANAGATLDDIVYRRFAWSGEPQSDDEAIVDGGRRNQRAPSLAMGQTGDFVLAWTSIGQDGDAGGLYARRFASFVNSRPSAEAGGPYALAEGDSLRLDATGSNDPDEGQTTSLRYDWDLDGDGAFDDLVGVAALRDVAWDQLAAAGVRDDGAYPLRLRVTDSLGATSVDEVTLTVRNAAPTGLTLDTVAPVDEGSEAILRGTFVDAGYADTHVLQVQWAPGVVETYDIAPGEQVFEVRRRYVDDSGDGAFLARVTVTDDDGGTSDAAAAAIVVRNVAPTIEILDQSATAIREGESLTIIGVVRDPGLDDVHTLLIDWGDGTSPEYVPVNPLTDQFVATHLYRDGESIDPLFAEYRIDFLVSDNSADLTRTATEVIVQNVAPRITELALSANAVGLNEPLMLSGLVVDPGVLDAPVLLVQWGDATVSRVEMAGGSAGFELQHSYTTMPAQGGSYRIILTVTDKDDGFAMVSVTVQVRACSLAGDANDDCTVNLDDLNGVRNHFGDGINGGPRIPGDTYPFDGIVDLDDLNAVRNNFGVSAAPLSVSPPAEAVAGPRNGTAYDIQRAAEDAVFARWAIEDAWRPAQSALASRGLLRKLIP